MNLDVPCVISTIIPNKKKCSRVSKYVFRLFRLTGLDWLEGYEDVLFLSIFLEHRMKNIVKKRTLLSRSYEVRQSKITRKHHHREIIE